MMPDDDGFDDQPGVEGVAVGGPGHVEEERGHATEVLAVGLRDHRSTAGTGSDDDQALHLEEPQRLAERGPADLVALEQSRLGREPGARFEPPAVADDLAGDRPRRPSRCAGRSAPARPAPTGRRRGAAASGRRLVRRSAQRRGPVSSSGSRAVGGAGRGPHSHEGALDRPAGHLDSGAVFDVRRPGRVHHPACGLPRVDRHTADYCQSLSGTGPAGAGSTTVGGRPVKLEGQVAIVTGAGSKGSGLGTGKAMAVLFAA